jgi:oligoribonuclease (3'-5' exoribonuclease)
MEHAMKNAYLAIDLETSGLDKKNHQILEIGAVFNDPSLPLLECPTFQSLVSHENISGTPFALEMNQDLIARIADGEGDPLEEVLESLATWVRGLTIEYKVERVHPLGKNVAGFDMPFLNEADQWDILASSFHYRCLDVGSLFATPNGISSQSALLEQVALDEEIPGEPHTALFDARVSLGLARQFWEIMSRFNRWLNEQADS